MGFQVLFDDETLQESNDTIWNTTQRKNCLKWLYTKDLIIRIIFLQL